MASYVQYGSGFSCPDGWISFDSSPTLRFERLPVIGRVYSKNSVRFPSATRYGDVVAGLPVESGSCDGVYASHVLEHLCLDDFRTALNETLRILAVDGIFRVVVPDLSAYAERYVSAALADDSRAAHQFMEDTSLGTRSRSRSLMSVAARVFGNSSHLWMWDEASMRAELEAAGFTSVRRAQLGDCADTTFSAVEDPARFVDALAMEARK